MTRFAVIAAVDDDWGIGSKGIIPWRYAEDFRWFKKTTMGSTCIMGRNTYLELASIMKGKAELLPGRKSVVVTSRPLNDYRVEVCNDLNAYKNFSQSNFFIGGSSIFEFGLNAASVLYLTRIPGTHDCDVFFPMALVESKFTKTKVKALSDDLNVITYERRKL